MWKLEKILKVNDEFPFPGVKSVHPVWRSWSTISGLFTNTCGVSLWIAVCIVPFSLFHLVISLLQTPTIFCLNYTRCLAHRPDCSLSPQCNSVCILLPDFVSKEFMSRNLYLIEIWAAVHLYNHRKKLPKKKKVLRKEIPFHTIVAFSQFTDTLEISLVLITANLPVVCEYSNTDTFFQTKQTFYVVILTSFLKC